MTRPLWDEPGWAPLPPLEGECSAEVCVVGLGVAGLSALHELVTHGHSAVGIDATGVAAGASGRNGGFLLGGLADFHHRAAEALGHEAATALYRATLDELDRAEELAPDAVSRTGSLRIAWDVEELRDCEAQLAAMRADDLPVEPYEGPEGQGLRFPQDAAAQPMRRTRALARLALAEGATLHEATPALEITGDRVRTPAGQVRCERVLVCVDGGLERVLAALGASDTQQRVRTARAQMLATAPVRETVATQPVYTRWGYDYWQQLRDGRIALGGARDRGGDAEWTCEAEPSAAVQAELDQVLRDHLQVRAPVTHRWAGIIAYGDGPLPLLEEVRPGVIAVGAYRGTGNLVGAVFGRAAARLALTGRTDLPGLPA